VAKLALTLVGTLILIQHLRGMSAMEATGHAIHDASYRAAQMQHLLHAGGGLLLLLAVTALSIFKPWGPTPYGQRTIGPPEAPVRASSAETVAFVPRSRPRTPRWAVIVGWHVAGLLVLAAVLHFVGFHGGHLE
jgi:hypothetical protein